MRPVFSFHAWRVFSALFVLVAWASLGHAGPFDSYVARLPRTSDGGILFSVKAPGARAAYLVGDFNGWGGIKSGSIPKARTAMEGPDDNGVFTKTLKLTPGSYGFRYVIHDHWDLELPVGVDLIPFTPDGNNVLQVNVKGEAEPGGTPYVYPPRPTENGMEFRVFAPSYSKAYLVGTFNSWGNQKQGIVTDESCAMQSVDYSEFVKTISLSPGKYEYMVNLDNRADRWMHGSDQLPMGPSGRRFFMVEFNPLGKPKDTLFAFPPRVVNGGVEFCIFAPDSTKVSIAGTFNGWGNHKDGQINSEEAQMAAAGNGFFFKKFDLIPETYSFQYVVEGNFGGWHKVDEKYLPRDHDSNSMFTLSGDQITEMKGKRDPRMDYAELLDLNPSRLSHYSSRFSQSSIQQPIIYLFYQPGNDDTWEVIRWLHSDEGKEYCSATQIHLFDCSKYPVTPKEYNVSAYPTAVWVNEIGEELGRTEFDSSMPLFMEKFRFLGGTERLTASN